MKRCLRKGKALFLILTVLFICFSACTNFKYSEHDSTNTDKEETQDNSVETSSDILSGETISEISIPEEEFVTPASTAPKSTPTTAATPTTLSFNPSGDAFVSQIKPDDNNGSITELRVRGGSGSVRNIKSYLKFVVSGGAGTVQSAKLKLYSDDVAMNVYAKAVLDTLWSESDITWNNAPAMGCTLDTVYADTGTWVEFDVTSHITGNGTFSIGLAGETDEPSRDFLSKEAESNIPVLEVTFSN